MVAPLGSGTWGDVYALETIRSAMAAMAAIGRGSHELTRFDLVTTDLPPTGDRYELIEPDHADPLRTPCGCRVVLKLANGLQNSDKALAREIANAARVYDATAHHVSLTTLTTPPRIYKASPGGILMMAYRQMESSAHDRLSSIASTTASFRDELTQCAVRFLLFSDAIRSKGFVHQDAKLDNMMWGRSCLRDCYCEHRQTSEYSVSDYGTLCATTSLRPGRPIGTAAFISPLLAPAALEIRDELWRLADAEDRLEELKRMRVSEDVDPAIVDFHSMGASIADLAAAVTTRSSADFAFKVAGVLLRCGDRDRPEDLINRVRRLGHRTSINPGYPRPGHRVHGQERRALLVLRPDIIGGVRVHVLGGAETEGGR